MEKQKGFVLVSVLIITTITTMLALAQIKEIRLQERIGGNQQKEINARFAAEEGLFAVFEHIKEENANNVSNAVIQSELKAKLRLLSAGKNYSFPSDSIQFVGDTFTMVSMGEVNGAVAYLKTNVKVIESIGVFDNALVTCSDMNLSGNFTVDSFDKNQAGKNNGNVTVMNGSATIGGSALIDGKLTASGNVTGADKFNVTGGHTDGSEAAKGNCDPLDIANNMPTSSDDPVVLINLNDNLPGDYLKFSELRALDGNEIGNGSNATVEYTDENETDPINMHLFDDEDSTSVYVFENLDLSNKSIDISGDVTFFITGDMNTFKTEFTLADNSSLTIFIEGKTYIRTNNDIFSDKYADNGKVPITIYSSKVGDDAVKFQGNAQMYMNLYAPLGSLSMNGGTKIMGSIRTAAMDVVGTSAIHYDEGLSDLGGEQVPASTSYSSVYYHYE